MRAIALFTIFLVIFSANSILDLELASLSAQNVKVSSSTQKIVHSLKKANLYEINVFSKASNSPQTKQFEELKATATDEELRQLTDHKNGVIRVYAFKALEARNASGLFEIVVAHLNDLESIDCLYRGNEWIHSSYSKNRVAEILVSSKALSEPERFQLDSLLIYTTNDLVYTQHMLQSKEVQASFYPQIKKLVEQELQDINVGASIALAKYQKEEDLILIEKSLLEWTDAAITKKKKQKKQATGIQITEAIEHFPHDYFKKTLNTLSEKGRADYYEAAAVFQDDFSLAYLQQSLNQASKSEYARTRKVAEIYRAIEKYKSPLFDFLLFDLWEQDQCINDSLFHYLLRVDSVRCQKMAFKSLQKPELIDNSTLVIVDLLNFLIAVDATAATPLIAEQIAQSSVPEFKYFSEAAVNLDPQKIAPSLLARYRQESNPHICIPIVESVLSFEDPLLNEQLLEEVEKNTVLQGWGAKKIEALLEQKGL